MSLYSDTLPPGFNKPVTLENLVEVLEHLRAQEQSDVSSLGSTLNDLANKLTALLAATPLPTRVLGCTLDDVGDDFFGREQASLATKLTSQLAWATSQQQHARFVQKMIVTARAKGLYP